ncbi:probable inactive serine/threonine-protein kinase bub1 isoform X2 [Homarus americanus]|uniref:probable inactive serine/threonine-protein kinase bub1 isoform X2 n=1 Tax=Homarus americanus TaxID=6706 RepID=UPI001C485D0C|nr:probable inactive serine/threonine-protein kinase bub1 isoform X2 [Homarus americanus]
MDVGDESANRWELSKENIQPLKHGRKAAVLSVVLNESATQKLNATMHVFEEELRTYSGDDPLDVWYRYILWVEQSYPKGGKDGNIKKLIEKCLSSVYGNAETNEKYKNDPRFLDIWLKYADLCARPVEVYQTLEAKGICTLLTDFYINWSWEMEKAGNYKRADIIYQNGMQIRAEPADVLQEAHKKFQMRVTRSTMEGRIVEQESNYSEPQRTVLNSLKSKGHGNRVPNERVGSSVVGPAGRVSQEETKKNAGGPSFSIFRDTGSSDDHSRVSAGESRGGSLPVGAAVNQENVKNPGQWTKKKVPQKTCNVVSVDDLGLYQKPAFSVHADENISLPTATPSKLPQTSNVLATCKDYKDWHVEMFIAEPFNPKVQPQYCKHKVYCGNEEFSFEELKAAQYFKKEKEEKKKNEELEKMQDMLKKQEELIQQLLQDRLNQQKQEQAQQSMSRSLYQDSWIAINKSVNASVNVSNFLDESSTSNLLQCQPATACLSSNEASVIRDQTPTTHGANPTPQDNSQCNSSSNSRGLNLTDPTINTKMAVNVINDIWSASLYQADSQQDIIESDVGSDMGTQPVAVEAPPFTILQDEEIDKDKQSKETTTAAFSIYTDNSGDNNGTDKTKPSQPFSIFQDGKNTNQAKDPNDMYFEDQDENRPPPGMVQQREYRQVSGVLQPAADIPFLPLEDQESQKESEILCEDKGPKEELVFDDDLNDIVPLDGVSFADFTLKMPNNPEAFAKMANAASTPAPWSLGHVPQATVNGDDFTMAVMKVNNHFPLIEDKQKEDSEELMPPPVKQLPPTSFPAPVSEVKLSPIMEASREYRSSSSSSSGYSTTSTTLGGHSAHGLSQHGGFSMSTQMSRTRQHCNTQQECGLEIGVTAHTGDFTKSGYLADKSRGESMADSRPGIVASQNAPWSEEKEVSSFDAHQVAAMLMDMDDMKPLPMANSTKLDVREPKILLTSKENNQNFPEKINPFAEEIVQVVLSKLEEPVEARGGFVTSHGKLPFIKTNSQITLGSEMFHVRRIRGEGAYAKVYQASTIDPMNVTIMPTEEEEDDENEDDEKQMILKVQKPPCPWEFFICHELRQRLKSKAYPVNMLDSVMRINRGYFFSNGSILVNQYHKYGSLLDVMNG